LVDCKWILAGVQGRADMAGRNPAAREDRVKNFTEARGTDIGV